MAGVIVSASICGLMSILRAVFIGHHSFLSVCCSRTSKADSGLKLLTWLLMGFMRALPPPYCLALKAALWAILERSQALERHLRVPVLGGWPGKHLERIAGAWFCHGASRFQRLAIGR